MRVAIFLLVLLCVFSPSWSTAETLTLLHTNDHHGSFWRNAQGEGGLAAQRTLVNRIRATATRNGEGVLVLSAGDVNTGVGASDFSRARPDFLGMRAIGYDAMVLGNHEFDVSMPHLMRQQEWGKFPFLSANVVDASGRTPFRPYVIRNVGNTRVAILGLTTNDVSGFGHSLRQSGLRIDDPIAVASRLVPRLRQQADVVVVLSHLGSGRTEAGAFPTDRTLAAKVPGIDVILGGHDHVQGAERVGNTLIAQAGSNSRHLGRVDLQVKDGRVVGTNHRLLPVNALDAAGRRGPVIPEDPALVRALEPYQARAERYLNERIGVAETEIQGVRPSVLRESTPMGRLISRSFRASAQADVAIESGGRIRGSFQPGQITRGDVHRVLPFDSELLKFKLSGKELTEYFKQLKSKALPGARAFAHVSGLRAKDGQLSVKTGNAWVPVRPAGEYRLALPDYLAGGGDGYPDLLAHRGLVRTGIKDAQAVEGYIKAVGGKLRAGSISTASKPVPGGGRAASVLHGTASSLLIGAGLGSATSVVGQVLDGRPVDLAHTWKTVSSPTFLKGLAGGVVGGTVGAQLASFVPGGRLALFAAGALSTVLGASGAAILSGQPLPDPGRVLLSAVVSGGMMAALGTGWKAAAATIAATMVADVAYDRVLKPTVDPPASPARPPANGISFEGLEASPLP